MKRYLLRYIFFVNLFFLVEIAHADQVLYVEDAEGNRLQPVTAIDNVCAWPNLTLMPDGSVVAIVYGEPSHGTTEGHIECWASENKGKAWSLRGLPAPHEPNTNRMNHAAGLANNGDLVVICSGWSNEYPPGKQSTAFRAYTLLPCVSRSSDGGRTWTINNNALKPPFTTLPNGAPLGVVIPFGDILPGKDGLLHASLYLSSRTREEILSDTHAPRPLRACFLTSTDNGTTWGDPVFIDSNHTRNETAILHLGKGKWLAASRGDGLSLYRGDDDGKKWVLQEQVTSSQQHPGHLYRLRDSRVLLTYGNRKDHRIEVRFSEDEGHTWGSPLVLVDFAGDGGYPASVQLEDGQIITAYYSSVPHYAMKVVAWNASPVPKPSRISLSPSK